MDDALLRRLETVSPLLTGNAGGLSVPCKLCKRDAHVFDVVDLHKHCAMGAQYQFGLSGIEVAYHRCRHCGFLFTNFFDEWTRQDCARFIYNDDYVLVDPDYTGARPAQLAAKMAKLLRGEEGLRILDYGSGSGIFASKMRLAGFRRIESYDPFSSPSRPQGRFDLVTCFEVLEHMPWPDQALREILAWLDPGGSLIFSQTVQPPNIAEIRGAWWYLAPRNGHVSMFTVETLSRLLPTAAHALHGNGWLWAMAPPDPHPSLASVLAAIGPALAAQAVFAPASGGEDAWHGSEASAAGPFRWSKGSLLEWSIAPCLRNTRFSLRIPYALEIKPGFAARCQVRIGDAQAHVTVSNMDIVAEADVQACAAPMTVRLQTPEPISPFDLRGAPDGRRLGLGVLID